MERAQNRFFSLDALWKHIHSWVIADTMRTAGITYAARPDHTAPSETDRKSESQGTHTEAESV